MPKTWLASHVGMMLLWREAGVRHWLASRSIPRTWNTQDKKYRHATHARIFSELLGWDGTLWVTNFFQFFWRKGALTFKLSNKNIVRWKARGGQCHITLFVRLHESTLKLIQSHSLFAKQYKLFVSFVSLQISLSFQANNNDDRPYGDAKKACLEHNL